VRVLFDTKVVLDALLAREPHVRPAAQLMSLVDAGRLDGVILATTVTTIHNIATKSIGCERAGRQRREFLTIVDVAAVERRVLLDALTLEPADDEDAVLHEVARASSAAAMVTRNSKDFGRATVPVFTPPELLAAVIASSGA
jgi:predicted nucleic acid-binding protein